MSVRSGSPGTSRSGKSWQHVFPKFRMARSRLYRSRFFQANICVAASLRIYNICALLHRSKLKIGVWPACESTASRAAGVEDLHHVLVPRHSGVERHFLQVVRLPRRGGEHLQRGVVSHDRAVFYQTCMCMPRPNCTEHVIFNNY